MADMLRRIFGMGPGKQPTRPDFVQFEGDGARLRMVEDNTASAIAAKHNFAAIYGAANMPPNFAMRGVIEVPDGRGGWTPVSGSNNFVPDMTAQLAFLQGYRETGQIGMQPLNPEGSMATATGAPGGEGAKTPAEGAAGGGAAGNPRMTGTAANPGKAADDAAATVMGGAPSVEGAGATAADRASKAMDMLIKDLGSMRAYDRKITDNFDIYRDAFEDEDAFEDFITQRGAQEADDEFRNRQRSAAGLEPWATPVSRPDSLPYRRSGLNEEMVIQNAGAKFF